jgi:hypothetical protein
MRQERIQRRRGPYRMLNLVSDLFLGLLKSLAEP